MGAYKIKDIELLTGIKAHTIRIWEKRYGILQPERTGTKIRSYSDDELLLLLNVAVLNRHGIKISRIAEMSQQEITDRVAAIALKSGSETEIEQMIVALIRMDEALLRNTLDELIREHGLVNAYQQYVIAFLERIGVMWLVGSINPAQEHFVSNIIRQRLIAGIDALPVPQTGQPLALLFLPEHEWHELALLLYQFHLRKLGISTIYLGQALPYASLIETLRLVRPKWIITSWLTAVDEKFIVHYFRQLRQDAPGIVIAAGGFQLKLHEEALKNLVHPFHSIRELELLTEQSTQS